MSVDIGTGPWSYRRYDSGSPTADGGPHAASSHSHSHVKAKAKAADSHVISNILTSLNTPTPFPVPLTNDQYVESSGKRSRAHSSAASVASSASVQRGISSPGFGVEYGTGLQLDDDEGLTDAALPPIIPTSRPPSGLSHRTSQRATTLIKTSGTTSFRMRAGSSFSTSDNRSVNTRNKLSSESWVRQSIDRDKDSDDASFTSRGRTPRKGLRRVGSQEALRPVTAGSLHKQVSDLSPVSQAEQIIAKDPAPLSTPKISKTRLYLTDSTIIEDQAFHDLLDFPSPIAPVVEQAALDTSPQAEGNISSDQHLSVTGSPPLKTSSSIEDSIPTRTSSLRRPSKSPSSGKKRSKTPKRPNLTPSTSGEMKVKHSKPKIIPDSSWADLDEDDKTVKRIRQLRELRKSRLKEEFDIHFSSFGPTDILNNEVSDSPGNERTRPRSPADRPAKEPAEAFDALHVIHHETPLKGASGFQVNGTRAVSASPDPRVQPVLPISALYRPTTSKSETSASHPSGLDYSYAEAVDLLDVAEGTEHLIRQEQSHESSPRPSLQLKDVDLQRSLNRANFFSPQRRLSKKATRSSQDSKRSGRYPELPTDFEKRRNRRKSMSDTRHARAIEEEEELERKALVEKDVLEYLTAPRLSRTVKNPTTGRTIAFSEVGDPEGAAVLVCVGMGLTRYVTAFYDELATTLRLRLITLDRPGVGGSAPFSASDKSGPLNWPEDVLAVCQHLGIIKFSILAHSAGAIYALATALILPHLVKGKVHLLAPWVPPSQLEAISHPAASAPPSNPLPRSQRFLRVLPAPFLKAANASFMTATSASLKPAPKRNTKPLATKTPQRRYTEQTESSKQSTPIDRSDHHRRESMMLMDQFMPTTNPLENFPAPLKEDDGGGKAGLHRGSWIVSATASPTDPSFVYAATGLYAAEHTEMERQIEYTSSLTQRTWELATRDSNPATDLLVCLERTRDVGFRYTDVGREIVITHGSEDKRVPIANVRWLGEQMNRRAMGLNLGDDELGSRESLPDVSSNNRGCEVRVLEGEGHGLMASPAIMSDILTEIAGYWPGPDKGRL